MAYTTPPDFVTGAILSAAQLNILSDDVDFLNGIAQAPNIPFQAYEFVGTESRDWYMRYRHPYLLYYYDVLHNPADDIKIYVNDVEVFHDGAPGEETVEGHIDLAALGLTLRSWYKVTVSFVPDSGSTLLLKLLAHANATSL